MPEHFHLLISEPDKANPSVVIQALKLGVVRRLFPTSPKTPEKWDTLELFDNPAPKHFWQKRFYDFNVWRWSSFRAYAFGETGPVVVNDWSVLKMKIRAP
jgi:REP element-mobilizing transposase RayT